MTRKVFFSFKYEDVSRAMVVRKSWVTQGKEATGFIDAADFEKIKRQGDTAIKNWINNQLKGTSVTVVLVGEKTCNSKWVKYEIEKSKKIGKGLLGIDISKIKNLQGETSERCGQVPKGYNFYLWNNDKGYENIGDWIEKAAKDAGTRAKGLQQYIDKNKDKKVWGRIVIESHGNWRLNCKEKYEYNPKDLSSWKVLEI